MNSFLAPAALAKSSSALITPGRCLITPRWGLGAIVERVPRRQDAASRG
jgi:hypothetical protein